MRMLILGFWCLLLGWIVSSSRPARAQGGKPAAQAANEHEDFWGAERDVEGFGVSPEKAKAEALQEALKRLRRRLLSMDPPVVHWQPDVEFVRNYLLEGSGKAGEGKPHEYDPKTKDRIIVYSWIYQLKAPPLETIRYFESKERRGREILKRRAWAAKGLGIGLLVCVAAVGVLHLGRRRQPSSRRL